MSKTSRSSKCVSNQIQKQMAGTMPVFDSKKATDEIEIDIQIGNALNWYNMMASDKKERKWFLTYAEKNKLLTKGEVGRAKTMDSTIFSRVGRYTEMISNGFPIEEWAQKYIDACVAKVKKNLSKKKTVTKSEPSIQERMDDKGIEKASEIIQKVDEFYCEMTSGKLKKKDDAAFFDIESFLNVNEIKPAISARMVPHIEQSREEWNNALADDRSFYDHMSDSEIKRMIRIYDWILEGLNIRAATKRTTKRTRKRKEKTPADLVKRIKYLEKTDLYGGHVSVAPEKLIGATKVCLFNAKTRQMYLLESQDKRGFTVKGTTIQNVNIDKSVCKRIRETQVNNLLQIAKTQGIRGVKTAFIEITSKPGIVNGRMNANMIIMKVYK